MKINNLKEAIEIFSKYYGDEQICAAEHDQIWIAEFDPEIMNPVDFKRLFELGWFQCSESENWSSFV